MRATIQFTFCLLCLLSMTTMEVSGAVDWYIKGPLGGMEISHQEDEDQNLRYVDGVGSPFEFITKKFPVDYTIIKSKVTGQCAEYNKNWTSKDKITMRDCDDDEESQRWHMTTFEGGDGLERNIKRYENTNSCWRGKNYPEIEFHSNWERRDRYQGGDKWVGGCTGRGWQSFTLFPRFGSSDADIKDVEIPPSTAPPSTPSTAPHTLYASYLLYLLAAALIANTAVLIAFCMVRKKNNNDIEKF